MKKIETKIDIQILSVDPKTLKIRLSVLSKNHLGLKTNHGVMTMYPGDSLNVSNELNIKNKTIIC